MTGQGGWPLTVFLDPDGRAVLRRHLLPARAAPGNAELPPGAGGGRARHTASQREELRAASDRVREPLGAVGRLERSEDPLDPALLEQAVSAHCSRSADTANGGFGGAPKFPPASALEFLLARGESEHVGRDPRRDDGRRHLRPGRRRLPPLLGRRGLARPPLREDALRQRPAGARLPARLPGDRARSASGASAATHSTGRCARCAAPRAASTRRSTPTRRARRAASTSGRRRGADALRGRDAGRGRASGCSATTGSAPPATSRAATSSTCRWAPAAKPPPGLDEARAGAARAARAAGAPRARRQAAVLLERADDLRPRRRRRRARPRGLPRRRRAAAPASSSSRCATPTGRLLRTWKDGEGRLNAYLEDHAFLVEALLRLYEATLEVRWFDAARETAEAMIERFGDDERGGFFSTSHDHEQLIARRKDLGDHPIPSGNSSAALGLLRLAALTGERATRSGPSASCGCSRGRRSGTPTPSATTSRRSTSTSRRPARWRWWRPRAAPTPTPLAELAGVVRAGHRPHLVLAGGPEGSERPELLRERPAVEGKPAAYVCEHFACKAPVTEPKRARSGPGIASAHGRGSALGTGRSLVAA